MKNQKIIYFKAFLIVLFLFGAVKSVKACDCDGQRGGGALADADAAFSGKVSKIEFLDSHGENTRKEPRIVVYFEVYRVWKGTVKKKIRLNTVYNYYSCAGYWFYEG